MTDRSIDLFDNVEHPNAKHNTTHVHAYLRFEQGGYTVYVCPYFPETAESLAGIRRYPLSAAKARRIEAASRFSAKRLAALAADPNTLNTARSLAGLE
jgi:hypothetical protein